MVLAMMFWRLTVEMVRVDLEDLDFAETGAIGWILLVLATVAAEMEAAEMEAADLLRW